MRISIVFEISGGLRSDIGRLSGFLTIPKVELSLEYDLGWNIRQRKSASADSEENRWDLLKKFHHPKRLKNYSKTFLINFENGRSKSQDREETNSVNF
jgi:hypothetical protein